MARRDRRRAIPALAASLLVHLALLIVVMHVAGVTPRALELVAEPDFQVQLVTQPPPAAPSTSASLRPSRRVAPVTALVAARPAPPRLRLPPTPLRQAVQTARPAPPHAPSAPAAPPSRASASVPAAGASSGAAGGGAQGGGRWAVQGEEEGQDGVRKFLRATVGCSHEDYVGLSEQERSACDRRIGQEARSIGIPADRIASFIAAAEAQERRRADRTGPMKDLFVPCTGPGANLDRGCINMTSKHPEDEPY